MTPIRNGLNLSQFGIPLCLALALCLAPPAAHAEEAAAPPESTQLQAEDAAVAAIDAFIAAQKVDKARRSWKSTLSKPPKVAFTAGKTYFWNLETNKGKIKIKLMPEVAPMHVSSTIYLTRLGFYDDTIFHRVIPGFMAQGGDPTGTGRGGPGYKYDGEFDASVKHDKPGMLSMANAGPNTNGSQFFIMHENYDLPPNYVIFGHVIEGQEVVDTIATAPTKSNSMGENSTPVNPVIIQTITITEN